MSNISDRITEYLGSGGLFNPEAMEHDKARALLIDCRAYVDELREAARKVRCKRCGDSLKDETSLVWAGPKLVPCPDCADLRRLLGEKP